jgi:hypothetical protein
MRPRRGGLPTARAKPYQGLSPCDTTTPSPSAPRPPRRAHPSPRRSSSG